MNGFKPFKTLYISISAISVLASHPAYADIDLVGNPTLYSTTDVTLSSNALLSSFSINQHTLDASTYNIDLDGDGRISQGGHLEALYLSFQNGALDITGGSSINSWGIDVYSTSKNTSLSASGNGTTITTFDLQLQSMGSQQVSLQISDDATVQVANQLDISTGSLITIDNGTLNIGTLNNQGRIDVTGTQSQLTIYPYNSRYGKILLAGGATLLTSNYGYDDLSLNSGDLISASDSGTQIYAGNTSITDTTLSLDAGASFTNYYSAYLNAISDNATLSLSGSNTVFTTSTLELQSQNGYRATLSVSNGARINGGFYNSVGSVIIVDNAVLSATGDNQGRIEIKGSQSQVIFDNNSPYGYGEIHFSGGAVFTGDSLSNELWLHAGDRITASGPGTQINTEHALVGNSNIDPNVGDAFLSVDSGASFTNTNTLYINGAAGNGTMSASGSGTQLTTYDIKLQSMNGYQATLLVSDGATAKVFDQVTNSSGSVIVLDNGLLSADRLDNQGRIEVKGSQSQLYIWRYINGYGKIHFSDGAVFTGFSSGSDLWLQSGDLISASGLNTQINIDNTTIENTLLSVDSGASYTSNYLTSINAFLGDAELSASGYGTQVSGSVNLHSLNGQQARMSIADGAMAYISSLFNSIGSLITVDNATLNIGTFNNEGRIEVTGSQSQLTLGATYNGYGEIHFADGAIFTGDWGNTLYLTQGDLISAAGAGTQLNVDLTNIDGTTLSLNSGAALNSSHISVMAHAGDTLVSASGPGTRITADALYLDSLPGQQANLLVANGATVQVNTHFNNYAGSLVTVDNATLDIWTLNNQGRIDVKGSQSQLKFQSQGNDGLGQINFSNGAVFTGDGGNHLYVYQGDRLIASDTGTRFNLAGTSVNSTALSFTNHASIDSNWIHINANSSHAELSAWGANGTINTSDLQLQSTGNYTARLSLANGATLQHDFGYIVNSTGSVISIVNGSHINSQGNIENDGTIEMIGLANSIKTGQLVNRGLIHSGVDGNTLTANFLQNAGVIQVAGAMAFTGDLMMEDNGLITFTVSGYSQNNSPALTIDGILAANNVASIDFDLSSMTTPSRAFSMDLILFSSIVPDESIFNIDLSAFDAWGSNWAQSVDLIGDTLVLNVYSAVPLPAGGWLMLSALAGLVIRKGYRRA